MGSECGNYDHAACRLHERALYGVVSAPSMGWSLDVGSLAGGVVSGGAARPRHHALGCASSGSDWSDSDSDSGSSEYEASHEGGAAGGAAGRPAASGGALDGAAAGAMVISARHFESALLELHGPSVSEAEAERYLQSQIGFM